MQLEQKEVLYYMDFNALVNKVKSDLEQLLDKEHLSLVDLDSDSGGKLPRGRSVFAARMSATYAQNDILSRMGSLSHQNSNSSVTGRGGSKGYKGHDAIDEENEISGGLKQRKGQSNSTTSQSKSRGQPRSPPRSPGGSKVEQQEVMKDIDEGLRRMGDPDELESSSRNSTPL